jgi:hypothetical protein
LDDPQSLNLYSYLQNNPLGGVDADGHDSFHLCTGAEQGAGVCSGGDVLTEQAAQQTAQQQSPLSRFLSYFYMKGFKGSDKENSYEIKVKILGATVQAGSKEGTQVTRHFGGSKEETKITSDIHGKITIAGFTFGAERTVSNGNTEWSPILGRKDIESSGGQVGVGTGLCFSVCGQFEVGIEAGKIYNDYKNFVTDHPELF